MKNIRSHKLNTCASRERFRETFFCFYEHAPNYCDSSLPTDVRLASNIGGNIANIKTMKAKSI